MGVIYAAATCSEAVYNRLYGQVKVKPAIAAQKYHRLLMEGLAAHTEVDAVCYPPSNSSVMPESRIDLSEERCAGVSYHYLRVYRNRVRKLAHLFFAGFFRCLGLIDKDSVVMIDCLNQALGLGALLASKICRCRCVGIVTDLPEFQGGGPLVAVSRFLIGHCTDYVMMTEAMNCRVNPTGKPYVVLEGHADIGMTQQIPSLQRKGKKQICMYAGGLHEIYGIRLLVEGFRMASIADTELHLYGSGDFVPELLRMAQEDPRIVYGGMLLASEIVPREMEAALLVNPRPSGEEYVKYSFPSKTMEYMSTGTPVLMTRLPGLPREYEPYLFFIEEETAEGVARALRTVFSESREALFAKGSCAREFILRERNNVVQAGKVLAMLEGGKR